MRDLTGTTLGRYQIKERLGAGGMAVVYRAVQTALGREVALKVLAPALTEDVEFLRRFENEARTLAGLDHPNVLPVIDFDSADGVYFLAMPLARGGSLEEIVVRGPMDPGQAWTRFLRPVADALGHAHAAGIVHRDLKPANVLIHADGRPLLSDFGLARVGEASLELTAAGMTVGTPGYMAPEQVMGRVVDNRADIYAYGVMMFRMLTGRMPFPGQTAMEVAIATVHSPIPSASALRAELPDELDLVMERVLAKEPADRPGTLAELTALLNKVPQRRVAGTPAVPPAAPAALPPAPVAVAVPPAPAPPSPTFASAVSTLELQGVTRLPATRTMTLDSHFHNSLMVARGIAAGRWPDVARAAGLEQYIDAEPPGGEEWTTPVEHHSRLNEGMDVVFGADAREAVRQWGREATDRWVRQRTSGVEQRGMKLVPGQNRRLDLLLKSYVKGMDEIRGEHLHVHRQVGDDQFWVVQFANLYALGRRKPDKACHFWTAGLEALLRWVGLANDWVVSEVECGCVTGTFDCVFALRSARR